MDKDFWIERWHREEIGFHQTEVNRYLLKYWKQVSEYFPDSKVFVPLSGKSLDMIWLKEQGHSVTGIELSKKAVNDFFSENSLSHDIIEQYGLTLFSTENITLFCGDFFDMEKHILDRHHLVFDRAALVALPREMRSTYSQHLQKLLPEKATILQVIMTYPQKEMQGPPFSVTEEELYDLYSNEFRVQKLAEYNIFEENPRFQQRGMSQLTESVFVMSR